jgi:hypothetical protein
LDPFGNHLVLAAFLAVLSFPTAPLQATFNECGTAFTQKLASRFSLTTEGHNIDEADFFPALIALPRALVHRQTEAGHRGATGRITQLGVTGEIAEQDDLVKVCHTPGLF